MFIHKFPTLCACVNDTYPGKKDIRDTVWKLNRVRDMYRKTISKKKNIHINFRLLIKIYNEW